MPLSDSTALPGPPPFPILGAQGNFARFLHNPAKYMTNLYSRYGEVVTLARGTSSCVFVFGPELNREVLSSTHFFNLDAGSSPLRIPPGSSLARLFSGLTQMNGERHKQQRRMLIPAFQRDRFEQYCSGIASVTDRKLSRWTIGQSRDLFVDMKELTKAVAVKTLVGLDPEQGGDELGNLLHRWVNLVFSLYVILLPFDYAGLPYRRLLKISVKLEERLRRLIEEKKSGKSNTRDILSILIATHDQDKTHLSEDELVGQTNFLFMAGHATTASALTWTLFLLSQHPSTLRDILDECHGKLHGDAPTLEQLDGLQLLEATIKESMRLLPPVIWWARVSTAPVRLGRYHLPSATRVIHSAYITHRDPDVYASAQRFLPERWLGRAPDPYSYIPFSAGPRMCLGSTFAMMEVKIVLAMLLQRYRLTLRNRARIDFGGAMLSEPRSGMPVVVNRQDYGHELRRVRGNVNKLVDLRHHRERGSSFSVV